MSGLPTGTVTFLFTDVEGSTRMLEQLGAERYAEALGEHRRMIREAVAEHGGLEVDTQGDAFFCVFASARDAVAAAEDAQARLDATGTRVRMGLHTGEALLDGGHYVGMDVHRAARVGAAGHGGQVLLSESTVALLEPGTFRLRSLGTHRLKDLSAPQRLHQLGDRDFPPLKTLHRTNLPVPATPFLGRHAELEQVTAQVLEQSARLVTLSGPGGTGKTRLALQAAGQVADTFPGGVFWAPLAPLHEQALVASAVAQAVGVEESSGELTASISGAIDRPTLLLVDNCEHLLDGVAGVVSPLIRDAPELRVLATSREPLALGGERVVPVDPLERRDSVALFRARAEAAGATNLDDGSIGPLCARLDDLPLAVELAAARAPALPPSVLLERLSERLELLQGPRDADERQRTLRATIGWSYDLLSLDEQQLLRRVSAFAGGSTLAAVEEVAEADVEALASLVAKSLVRVTETPGGPRYWLLETIREFAAELLAATEEAEAVLERHAGWFAKLAEEACGELATSSARVWFERLEADLDNLRLALARALAHDEQQAVALGQFLAELHLLHGRYAEAQEAAEAAISRTDDPVIGALLRCSLGDVLVRRDDLAAAAAVYGEAERLVDPDPPGAGSEHRGAWLEVKLHQAGYHYWRGDTDALQQAADQLRPLIEEHGTPQQRARFGHVMLQNRYRQENYVLSEETEQLSRSSYGALVAAGDRDAHFSLGFTLLWRGKLDEAAEQFALGRERALDAGDVLVETRCLVYGAVAHRKCGDVERVRQLDTELEQLEDPHGYGGLIAANRTWLAWRSGNPEAAERWGAVALGDWDPVGRASPTVFQWSARFPLLAVAAERGSLEAAVEHARAMLDETQQPLPDDVRSALEAALAAGTAETFAEAVAVARRCGYT